MALAEHLSESEETAAELRSGVTLTVDLAALENGADVAARSDGGWQFRHRQASTVWMRGGAAEQPGELTAANRLKGGEDEIEDHVLGEFDAALFQRQGVGELPVDGPR